MSTQPLGNAPTSQSPADLVRRGLAAHRAGRLGEAERHYRGAIALHPADFDAMHLLGVCRSQQGDFEQAIDLLERCVALNPGAGAAMANLGNALQEAGRYDEARQWIERAIALMPANADLVANYGNVLRDMRQYERAIDRYRTALALAPAHAGARVGLGGCLHAVGRLQEALACLQTAVQAEPGDRQAQYNLGVVLADLGQPHDALARFEAALRLRADDVDTLRNLGLVLMKLERASEALSCLDRAVRIRPNHAEAHYSRANLLREMDRLEEALAAYDTAIACAPGHQNAHFNRGVTLLRMNRDAEAVECFDRVLAVAGEDAEALTNRGAALGELGRHQEALQDLTRALELAPDNPAAHSNRGVALNRLDRFEEAIASFDRALSAGFDGAYLYRATALAEIGRHAEALQDYERALACEPGRPLVQMSAAICLLRAGDFARGWPAIEARWRERSTGLFHWHDPHKLWLGQADVRGRTVLLHAEQGLGDTMQFCRYAPLVAARGATVWLESQPAAARLLKSLGGVDRIFDHGHAPPDFDLHVPLLSLPLAFGTTLATIPSKVPYLAAPADAVDRWAGLLGPRARQLRIGLAWSGSPTHKNDRRRSVPLEALLPLAQADVEWISLQVGVRERDRESVPRLGLRTFDDRLADLAETAALAQNLDLVITVDTSIAHLAGALGRPVWVMLQFNPDWRWLLDRRDSPWYPTARLFRQPAPGDWAPVVADILRALQAPEGPCR